MSVTRSQPTLTTKPHTNSRYTHASTPPQCHLMFLAFLAVPRFTPPPTHMRTTLRICVATTLLPPQRHLMFLAFLALHHTPNPPPTHMRTTLRICVATTLFPTLDRVQPMSHSSRGLLHHNQLSPFKQALLSHAYAYTPCICVQLIHLSQPVHLAQPPLLLPSLTLPTHMHGQLTLHPIQPPSCPLLPRICIQPYAYAWNSHPKLNFTLPTHA
ncbi:hypothetical protein PIB30_107891 [Stylosanthes scabra]|uniref:Uncharacterized protein n=1 Tax=Stylosanthes scabra TaxID=79078 RepID=A0ABU6YZG6_9FABA|nr:hypothetical protein [Stylosanthes scabra]